MHFLLSVCNNYIVPYSACAWLACSFIHPLSRLLNHHIHGSTFLLGWKFDNIIIQFHSIPRVLGKKCYAWVYYFGIDNLSENWLSDTSRRENVIHVSLFTVVSYFRGWFIVEMLNLHCTCTRREGAWWSERVHCALKWKAPCIIFRVSEYFGCVPKAYVSEARTMFEVGSERYSD